MKTIIQTSIQSENAKAAQRYAVFAYFVYVLIVLLISTNTLLAAQTDWHRIGPTGGPVDQITPDRGHPGVWYLRDSMNAGLYRSMDNGETWQFMKIMNVTKILVHSASSELFIILPSTNSYVRSLIYSSKDFGETFQLRTSRGPSNIFDHPTNPNVLWGSGVNNGYDLSVSYDRGAHWSQFMNLPYRLDKSYEIDGIKLPPSEYFLHSVLVSPFDSKTVYVSTEVFFDIICSGDSIFLEMTSTNGGKSWSYTQTDAPTYYYDPTFPTRAFSFSYSGVRILTALGWKNLSPVRLNTIVDVPGKANLLYAIQDQGKLMSVDGGVHWSRVSLGPPQGSWTNFQARTSPQDSLIMGSEAGIYIVDPNKYWHQVQQGIREPSVTWAVANAPNSTQVYAVAGLNFLFRSQTSGRAWKNITGEMPPLRLYDVFGITVNPHHGRTIYANSNYKWGIVSFDSGNTWKPLAQRMNHVFFTADPATTYFSRAGNNHLFKSSDGGITMEQLPTDYGVQHNTIFDLAVDPFSGDFYVATAHGLYRSKGNENTSEFLSNDLDPDCPHCLAFYQILALSSKGQFLAMTSQGIVKTINGGITWTRVAQRDGTIFLADNTGRHLFRIYQRLYESTDGGQTWQDITGTIDPELRSDYYAVRDLTDPRFRPLFVSTSKGIYRLDH